MVFYFYFGIITHMDTPIFYSLLFIHIISLITGFGAVIVIDFFGLMWMTKKVPLSQVNQTAHITQRLIWIGWTGLVLSGTGMIILKGYIDNLTAIKLFLVALLGLNGIFLHIIKKSLEGHNENLPLPAQALFRITLASTISQFGWWGAIIIGFLHRHIDHYINWPAHPSLWISGILLAISIAAIVGEIALRKKSTNAFN